MQTVFTGLRQSAASHSLAVTSDSPIGGTSTSVEVAQQDVSFAADPDAFPPGAQSTTPALPLLSDPDRYAVLGASPWRETLRGSAPHDGTLIRHETLRKQALGGARAEESEVELGPTAIAHNLAQRARAAGLTDVEAEHLQAVLAGGHGLGTLESDVALVTQLLETGNAADALRAFVRVSLIREGSPDRITPDIMRMLTLGVGLPRTAASEGREGILNSMSATAAAYALANMTPHKYETIGRALGNTMAIAFDGSAPPGADPQTECALILKAVGARSHELSQENLEPAQAQAGWLQILDFAANIRGVDAQQLIQCTSVIDLDGDGLDEALQQQWQNASGPAVLQMLRAERDPIYAWSLHADGTNGIAADEQASMLESLGTEAFDRAPDRSGSTSGMVLATMANAKTTYSNTPYYRMTVSAANRAGALDHIEALIKGGIDVAIAVSEAPGKRQAMAITAVRGTGASREFLVTDPWTGQTGWISNDALLSTSVGDSGGVLTDYWF